MRKTLIKQMAALLAISTFGSLAFMSCTKKEPAPAQTSTPAPVEQKVQEETPAAHKSARQAYKEHFLPKIQLDGGCHRQYEIVDFYKLNDSFSLLQIILAGH